jgi:tRNA(Ile)-lysidine synthase
MTSVEPVSDAEFADRLNFLGPFEPAPELAVAVSGGPDSMALLLLADRWARSLGGSVTALTVDHRLRPESAVEARAVAGRLGRRGIRHEILIRHGELAKGDLQAAARDARYALLEAWCRSHHVLHLLVGHHREDQAETLLLRLARGSGLSGLAGMPALAWRADIRVLRPLLDMPRARLAATVAASGLEVVEDPSNANTSFARVRVRDEAAMLGSMGLTPERLAATTIHLARARDAIERATASLLGRSVVLHPAGFASLDPAPWRAAPEEIRLRALAQLLTTIGGKVYPPRFDRLASLAASLAADGPGSGRVLGGCRIIARQGLWLVMREARGLEPPILLKPGGRVHWDGRYEAVLRTPGDPIHIGAAGEAGCAVARAIVRDRSTHHVPYRSWASLPGLWRGSRLISLPWLGWREADWRDEVSVRFRPIRPLCGPGFVVGFS